MRMAFPIALALAEILITLYLRPRIDRIQRKESFSKRIGSVARQHNQGLLYTALSVWLILWVVLLVIFLLIGFLFS